MAVEYQEIADSLSRHSIGSLLDEKAAPHHPSSPISCALSASNTIKKSDNKCIELKPTTQFPSKKGITGSESISVKDSDFYGGRSIIDLPPALVSEIFHCLDPKDLGIVSCVSTLLNTLASDHHEWKDFYCKRWGPPSGSILPPGLSRLNGRPWKKIFVERELKSKSFMGRFSVEALRGHTEAVRAVFLLQSAKFIFTGGYDSVIRMWDMEEGLLISASRPLGCTIRAIAADAELLVAGGTDAFVQCWKAIEGHPYLFDITGSTANHQNSEFRLWGHEGPISCLALDSTRIFSGSWDMSIRVWDRARQKCLKKLLHGDWIWALAPRGSTVASTAGRDAYVWDVEEGNLMAVISNAHVGNARALARSHTGDLLFTGGEDGSIHMFKVVGCDGDDDIKPATTWTPHTGPVHSLAFEFPWLVSSSSDGRIALINVRKLLGSSHRSSSRHHSLVKQLGPGSVEPPQRILHGFGCNLFSVAVGIDRIVSGGEEGVVRVWDFSRALEIEKRVRALRGVRFENRMRRRKVQIDMNGKGGQTDQSSASAKRSQMIGNRNGIHHIKRRDRKT